MNDAIDIVVNLTIPVVHVEVSLQIIAADSGATVVLASAVERPAPFTPQGS